MEIVKLKPAVKDYIWGGTKLKSLGKAASFSKISECRELSFHPDGLCIIDSGIDQGKTLKEVATNLDLGIIPASFKFFPCLIKLIDSSDNLSVQVHPSDAYALKNEKQFGKTEMWYILDHEVGAGIYVGLKKDSNKEEIQESLKDNSILDKLNFVEVNDGDSFFIESGTIHAIGKGVTLIEIQQNSNLTYRVYDYNRLGNDNKPRELHINKALNVINYKKYKNKKFSGNLIGKCDYFASYIYENKEDTLIEADENSFVSFTVIEGSGTFNEIPFKMLDSFFMPSNKKAILHGNCRYILTKVEK